MSAKDRSEKRQAQSARSSGVVRVGKNAKVSAEPQKPPTLPEPGAEEEPRRLAPWNPFDYLRLLWWVLVTPQRLKTYRGVFGEGDERRVGKWLTSTLIWLPLFIPTLALGLQMLPRTQDAWTPSAYMGLSLGLILVWALIGWLEDDVDSRVAIVALAVAFGAALLVAFGVVVGGVGEGYLVAFVVAFVAGYFIAVHVGGFVSSGAAVAMGSLVALAVMFVVWQHFLMFIWRHFLASAMRVDMEGLAVGGAEMGIPALVLAVGLLRGLFNADWLRSIVGGLIAGLVIGGGFFLLTNRLSADPFASIQLMICPGMLAFVMVVVVALFAIEYQEGNMRAWVHKAVLLLTLLLILSYAFLIWFSFLGG